MADWLIFELTQNDSPYVKAYLGYEEHETGFIIEIDGHNAAITNPRVYSGKIFQGAIRYITQSAGMRHPALQIIPVLHIRGTTKQGWAVTTATVEELPREPAWLKTAGRI